MKKTLFLIVGPSGSGKSTIADELEKRCNLKRVKSYTTRKRRQSEPPDAYTFVDHMSFHQFQDMVNITIYNNNKYGARLSDMMNADMYIVDPAGIGYMFASHSDKFNLRVIGIKADEKDRAERMAKRGDNPASIKSRIENDRATFDIPDETYDLIVENKNLQTAVARIREYMTTVIQNNIQTEIDIENRINNDFEYLLHLTEKHGTRPGVARTNDDGSIDILFGSDIAVTSKTNEYPHSSRTLLEQYTKSTFHIQTYFTGGNPVNISIYADAKPSNLVFTVDKPHTHK